MFFPKIVTEYTYLLLIVTVTLLQKKNPGRVLPRLDKKVVTVFFAKYSHLEMKVTEGVFWNGP